MLKALRGYSSAKDYFSRRFKVVLRRPSLEKIEHIKEILRSECSFEDLKVLKATSKSSLDQMMVYNSTITAIGIAAAIIGVVTNNFPNKAFPYFSLFLFALIVIVAAYFYMLEIGKLSLLNELVIEVYEEQKAKELKKTQDKELKDIIDGSCAYIIIPKK